MKIHKLGHCCLLIEENNTKILTDPGAWNNLPEKESHSLGIKFIPVQSGNII